MAHGDEIFGRGIALLSESPPSYIKSLSLLRKASKIYEQKGRIKEFHSAIDKIQYIYKSLYKRNLKAAKKLKSNSKYNDCIIKILESHRHLILSEPKNLFKESKELKLLFENTVVDFLHTIERKSKKDGFSNEFLSEVKFLENSIIDILYPKLKTQGSIPKNFILDIRERKIQRALINTFETLGNKSKEKASKLIDNGKINQGFEILEISRNLYESVNFREKIRELNTLYKFIFEAQGDAELTFGLKIAEKGRLNKGTAHMKKARKYYLSAENKKKVLVAEKNYLKISVRMGENLIKSARNALELNDLESAINFYDEAHKIFQNINDIKNAAVCEKKKKQIYSKLGDMELNKAENLSIKDSEYDLDEIKDLTKDIDVSIDFSVLSEILTQKIQIFYDAQFYYYKSEKAFLVKKTGKQITKFTNIIAGLLFEQAKKNLKTRNYEGAYLNFKKSIFYFEKLNQERKVKSIEEKIKKIYEKLSKKKLESLQKTLSEIEYSTTLKSTNIKTNDVESQDQLFKCTSCEKMVKPYFYDSIQQKCLDCRDKIFCDECSQELIANDIFMECKNCFAKFCLNCADKVFDFVQKACLSCRKIYNCSECNQEIAGDKIFICDVCNKSYCAKDFDYYRNACVNHSKDETCAKCGKELKVKDQAHKCTCGFFYCNEHFDTNSNICHICIIEKDQLITVPLISTSEEIIVKDDVHNLTLNTLKSIVEKYNHMEILDSEEISFLFKYQLNLPKDESRYLNFGESEDIMVILEDKKKDIGKLYVIMAPIIPITEGIKYIGDLMKKLIKYIPNIPENSTAGAAGIMNLLFLARNPRWDLMYDFLRQTLLKPGMEIINLMKITNEKKSISEIESVLKETHFAPLFKEVQIEEAIRQIKIVDSEEEIDLFAGEQRLNRLLKALYNLHTGNVLRASEILAIFEF